MKRTFIAGLLLLACSVAYAEGTIDGWVRVHGHHFPLYPVTVRVFDAESGAELTELRTENRPDGTYEINGVPDGNYKVHYDAHGDVWRYLDELAGNTYCDNAGCEITELGAVITVSGDTRTLNINLLEGVPMSGKVTDEQLQPLEGVTVEFFDEHGDPYCCSRLTDEEGRWARPAYYPGGYYVLARYADPSPYRPRVWANRDCSGCDIVDVGSQIYFPYYIAYYGIDVRLSEAGPDPDITVEPVAAHKYSGSWFDPFREGEGFIVEVLDRPGEQGGDQEVVVFWFTYGPDGEQSWMVGTGTLDERVAEVTFEITDGAEFGAAFDADDVQRRQWGSLRLEFLNCNQAHAQYGGKFGSGQLNLSRLSAIEGLGCGDPDDAVVSGNPALSGAWFNPGRDGEGFILEFVDPSQLLAYWFTYDTDGKQMWLIGVGQVDESGHAVLDMLRATGGKFGDQFDPDAVQLENWGQVSFQFDDCDNAAYSWLAGAPYGSGGFAIQPLTRLKSAICQAQ